MRVGCSCGRSVDIPDGETVALCPDCGRPVEAASARDVYAAVPPPPPGPRRDRPSRSPLLIAGAVVLVLMLMVVACAGLLAGLFWPMLKSAQADSNRALCSNNLRLIGTSLFMYANENRGDFPALRGEPGRMMFAPEALHPEYLQNPSIFVCPSLEEPAGVKPEALINDGSYLYLSHVVLSDAEGQSFARAYEERLAAGVPLAGDIPVGAGEGSGGTAELMRLRMGVERLLAEEPLNRDETDTILSRIPVLIEWPTHHDMPGGNVLFLDGHVEFVSYPGPFPMTERFIATLREMRKQ